MKRQVAVLECCSPLLGPPLDRHEANRFAGLLKALADPARLQLVSLIASSGDGEACVCDLTDVLELSQPTVSHHLRVLADAGILSREQRGRWAFYRVDTEALRTVADALTGRDLVRTG